MMLVYVLRPLPRSAGEPTLILQLASAAFAHSLRARRLTISLSRLAQASLALRPVHLLTHLRGPLSPRLRRVGRPSRLSGSYRAESTIPRAGLSPAASPLVSRHTRKDESHGRKIDQITRSLTFRPSGGIWFGWHA